MSGDGVFGCHVRVCDGLLLVSSGQKPVIMLNTLHTQGRPSVPRRIIQSGAVVEKLV